jgi:uncharacterized protein YyaL (SSP411 family)
LINWFECEIEAFNAAREQDKPVMLFLGAFWCGYCQRMDEEAFSDRENLALLNAYFIALRTEDATRPDIDARYNFNGWPTIVFFSPGGELLAAVNFLSIEDFKNVLLDVYLAYQRRDKAPPPVQPRPPDKRSVPARGFSLEATVTRIADAVMERADRVNGGYGQGQKFIQAAVNDFLLAHYERTANRAHLDHVRLTLDRMRQGEIHDREEGGYFRTTSGADWTRPHREKLLIEQAGLLANCLRVFRLTGSPEYARMAEEIVAYLDQKLFDPQRGVFFGCEDFFVRKTACGSQPAAIIDECVYADANALTAKAYLQAGRLLRRPDCHERALAVLDFLWNHCRDEAGGVYRYRFGAKPQLPGMLADQALTGAALVEAYGASGDGQYLARARTLAELILRQLRNSAGGFYDRNGCEDSLLKYPLTDLSQNGTAASFFSSLADAAQEPRYREAADWAIGALIGATAYGLDACPIGSALCEFLKGARTISP